MQRDDSQDASGCQCRCRNKCGRRVRSEGRENMPRGLTQISFIIPSAQERGAAADQYGQWESDEKCPKSDARPRCVPVNDLLGGVSRLVLLGLHVAEEERGHKEGGREDEEQFRSSEGVFV